MSRDKINSTELFKRIELIRQHYELSQYAISKRIKITPAYYSGVLNGTTGVGLSMIVGIAENFSEINLRWLLTGEGEMLGGRSAGAGHNGNLLSGTNDNAATIVDQQASMAPVNAGITAEQISRLLDGLTESEQGSIKTILQAIVGMIKKE